MLNSTFLETRAEIIKKFPWMLVDLKTLKCPFEINRPLTGMKKVVKCLKESSACSMSQ